MEIYYYRKMKTLAQILFFSFLLSSACKKDKSSSETHSGNSNTNPIQEGFQMYDAQGRTLILHGMATSNYSKFKHIPWIEESDVERERRYGFNVTRYVLNWSAIEPERGVYDQNYINETIKRIEWYTSREIYVLLDMHQDLYSAVFGGGGNGAPEWAVFTDGVKIGTYNFGDLWFLQYLTPEVINAFQNFYRYEDPYKFLQDHFIGAWTEIVKRVKDNPYVIGYELMNEPHPGDGKLLQNKHFAQVQLWGLYDRAIREIRKIDQEKWIFIEPEFFFPTGFGMPSYLKKVIDHRAGDPRLVFAPHIYPPGMEAGANYGALDKIVINSWKKNRSDDMTRHEASLFVSEFGGKNDRPKTSAKYVSDFCDMLDEMKSSWAAWSNDIHEMVGSVNYNLFYPDKTERPTFDPLIRAYPRATTGNLISFKYNPTTYEFTMRYINNTQIGPYTEIHLPDRRYPDGWDLQVDGVKDYSYEWEEEVQVLKLKVNEHAKEVNVRVVPK